MFILRLVSRLRILIVLIASAIAACIGGCSTPITPKDQAFQGIQIAFENGQLGGTIGDASDDWQPIADVCAEFPAAYPNPASSSSTLNIRLCQQDNVRVWVESAPGVNYQIVQRGVMQAGQYTLTMDWSSAPAGIYRCYLEIERDGRTYRTYGDVKVEH
ncbi:MAG TPA: hypothetical protein VHI13_06200 [Candidatus Kapabacteria bacterium]|nr:hypothetical protein [Candidatus Kapabacteria bacterium]